MVAVTPSLLSADFFNLEKDLARIAHPSVKRLHLDVMDGVFVNNISFGFPVIASLRKKTKLFLDCHLMIAHPENFVERFCKIGCDAVTFHIEAVPKPLQLLNLIRVNGKKCGLSVDLDTSIREIEPFLNAVDLVNVMGVKAGFGGQAFSQSALQKLHWLSAKRTENHWNFDIQVDGGVTEQNAGEIVKAGATILVTGNTLFSHPNPQQLLDRFSQL